MFQAVSGACIVQRPPSLGSISQREMLYQFLFTNQLSNMSVLQDSRRVQRLAGRRGLLWGAHGRSKTHVNLSIETPARRPRLLACGKGLGARACPFARASADTRGPEAAIARTGPMTRRSSSISEPHSPDKRWRAGRSQSAHGRGDLQR